MATPSVPPCEKEETTDTNPSIEHPWAEYEDFKAHPPIPLFNVVIDSQTGQLLEDRTGQP